MKGLNGATGAIRRHFMIFISIIFKRSFFSLHRVKFNQDSKSQRQKVVNMFSIVQQLKLDDLFIYFLCTSLYAVAFLTCQEAYLEATVEKKLFPLLHRICRKLAQQEDRDSSQLVNVHASM